MTTAASQFLIVGERTNITGSPKFAKALKAGDWNECLSVALQQVASGAPSRRREAIAGGVQAPPADAPNAVRRRWPAVSERPALSW